MYRNQKAIDLKLRTVEKISRLLYLRRRLSKKIFDLTEWSTWEKIKFYTKICVYSRNVLILFGWRDANLYNKLNRTIRNKVYEGKVLRDGRDIEIEPLFKGQLVPYWASKLGQFDHHLNKLGALLVVQGSFADGQTTNYSDLDLIIFYQHSITEIREIKCQIERFLLEIDPLQHHGVFMIDTKTFNFYWQMDLPIEVLCRARSLRKDSITLKITQWIDEDVSPRKAVLGILDVVSNLEREAFNYVGVWTWKYFLSQLMLLPTLYFATTGRYMYKAGTFERFRPLISDDAYYCLERASEIRSAWPHYETFNHYRYLRSSVVDSCMSDSDLAVNHANLSVLHDDRFWYSLKTFRNEMIGMICQDQ